TAVALSIAAGAYAAGHGLATHTEAASGRLSGATTPTTPPVTSPPPPPPVVTTTVPVSHHDRVDGSRQTPTPAPTTPRPHTVPPTIVVANGRCGAGTATATANVQIA